MVMRRGGNRRKTRSKLTKDTGTRGKLSLRNYLQTFKEGEKVILKPDSIIQRAMPYRRFHGKTGIIKAKKGNCYEVSIKDFKKEKTIIAHPIHLKRC